MKRYRKKSDVIEAVQFDPNELMENWPECVIPWPGDGPVPRDMSWGYISNRDGTKMHVLAGDWIIKTQAGRFYPCKPDIFETTYEPVEEKT